MDDTSAFRSITRQAAEWFLLCMQGELTVQQRQALRHWLRAAPEHAVALMEMCKLHARLPAVLARASNPASEIRISQLTDSNTRLH